VAERTKFPLFSNHCESVFGMRWKNDCKRLIFCLNPSEIRQKQMFFRKKALFYEKYLISYNFALEIAHIRSILYQPLTPEEYYEAFFL